MKSSRLNRTMRQIIARRRGIEEIERLISNPSEIQIINNSNKLRPSFINIHHKLPNQVTSSVESHDVPRPWIISQRRHHGTFEFFLLIIFVQDEIYRPFRHRANMAIREQLFCIGFGWKDFINHIGEVGVGPTSWSLVMQLHQTFGSGPTGRSASVCRLELTLPSFIFISGRRSFKASTGIVAEGRIRL